MIRLRSLPVLLWLAGLTGLADAQIAPDHHWVGFADKVDCGVDLNDPEAGRQLLSERALDRRARHGIALDSLDLPVPPAQISAVLSVGETEAGRPVQLLHRSKWFNGIVIRLDTALVDPAGAAEVLAGIAALDGVIETRSCTWHETARPVDLSPVARPRSLQEHQSGPEGSA